VLFIDVFRPYQVADEKKLQAAMKSRQTPFDTRHTQSISDRLRGGHCCSVPPFLRPIEEEDGAVAVGAHSRAETPADDNIGCRGNGDDTTTADNNDDDVTGTSRDYDIAGNELESNTADRCVVGWYKISLLNDQVFNTCTRSHLNVADLSLHLRLCPEHSKFNSKDKFPDGSKVGTFTVNEKRARVAIGQICCEDVASRRKCRRGLLEDKSIFRIHYAVYAENHIAMNVFCSSLT
jgi:hypothetical protein